MWRKYGIKKEQLLFDDRALAALIIPLIIEQLLTVLVGMADSVMVANVGEAAVSGVSLVDNVMILFIYLFAALASGGAVVAGQYLGQKNRQMACKAATQMLWFVAFIALFVMAGIYLSKWFILHIVFGQTEAEVMRQAEIYLLIVTASIPFIAIYDSGAAIFRIMGNSKISMQVSILMNIVNVSGNALLIYGCGWGVAGAAVPTLLSRMLAAILITALLAQEKRAVHIEKTFRYVPDWRMIKRILGIGIPNGLENSMFQIGKILVLSIVSTYGTTAIAANAVGNVITSFQTLPGQAVTLAITTVIARCVGAGDYKQAEFFTRKLVGITYGSLLLVNLAVFPFIPSILSVYHLSLQTAETARQVLSFFTVSCVLIWPVSFALPAVLRAAGDAKFTMYVALSSMWICRVVLSYVLGTCLEMGLMGVWVAGVVDWCVRSILMGLRYKNGKWKEIRVI
ncbi:MULTISPECIES: MATE family efflux transporter [Mediterraneibacter]|jgi:putative MATE family efflux protein|uniref:MATE family efflux transporter n=1 Tax=Mediterraneibacter TaxID=2316020 RepID=UPI000E46EA35|nr:MATE family efflux transporter [Mediterraneibacter massiliensis]RGT74148.1 MATE family efflux transporter [Ruminococcus sp. AF18-22]